jgi:hypothetical protein
MDVLVQRLFTFSPREILLREDNLHVPTPRRSIDVRSNYTVI